MPINWNDGSEDYNKIYDLTKEVESLKKKLRDLVSLWRVQADVGTECSDSTCAAAVMKSECATQLEKILQGE